MLRGCRGVLVLAVALAAGACSSGSTHRTTTAATATTTTTTSVPTSTTSCAFTGDTTEQRATASGARLFLTDVRVGGHGCVDRVVFTLAAEGGAAARPGYDVRFSSGGLTEDPSGRPVTVRGTAVLVVTARASGVDLSGTQPRQTYTGPTDIDGPSDAPRIREVRRTGDFEGQMTWAIGLDRRFPFHVTVLDAPLRLIVDVG